MKIPVVVVGLAPQGLFLLRELSRADFDVHIIAASKTPGYYSRYGTKYIAADEAELADRLASLAHGFGVRARCYISSGTMLECILKRIPEIYELFEVYPRPFAAVAKLNNKLSTYELAADCRIPVLPTFTPGQDEQLRERLSLGERFIAKWNREVDDFGERAFKTRIVNSPADYDSVLSVVPEHDRNNLLFQLMLGSAQDRNVAHLGYYVDGECKAEYLAHQLRQYPQGITSFVEEYAGGDRDILANQSRALFRKVGYTGFGEAEFKFDDDYKTAYLLEVNPRTCGWSSALRGRYPNLEKLFLEPALRSELEVAGGRAAWCNLLRDWVAILRSARENRSVGTFFGGIASQTKVRTLDVFDARDIKPFFMQFVALFRKEDETPRRVS